MAPTELLALKTKLYVPAPTTAVPERVPVPLPLSTKVTPPGKLDVSLNAGAGVPLVVTEKFHA